MSTYRLHIEGRVQGVGFRPFIYHLAKKNKLSGWVSNGTDGVWTEVNGRDSDISRFFESIQKYPPSRAIITEFSSKKIEDKSFDDFRIIESSDRSRRKLQISPDFGMCDACRNEIKNTSDRRYHYPFTTCTNCGPRFSIMKDLPFDRERTAMDVFDMCPECNAEYKTIEDRRFYSQTNSCPECPVEIELKDKYGYPVTASDPISFAAKAVKNGNILALKGIGGYLLISDSTRLDTIERLRERKHRPYKPFALMYPDMKSVHQDLHVSESAEKLLKSPEAPIVILPLKSNTGSGMKKEAIAPGLHKIGAMLPYAPLFEMLMQAIGKPVIATSANLSSDPIIFEHATAEKELEELADFYLHHNREIHFPQDDSVVNINSKQLAIKNRRSRGYSPSFYNGILSGMPSTLAMGADMKSAFAIQHEDNTYISQYLGDLEMLHSQKRFELILNRLSNMLRFEPDFILMDKHPGYFSSQKGLEISKALQVPVRSFQHHKAHFASVLAENHLLEAEGVLGVVWDGLGYGDDGQIWGGEFFQFSGDAIERIGHLPYFPVLAGNKMSLEPRISAYSLLSTVGDEDLVNNLLRPGEKGVYSRLADNSDLMTSSMGRVFDAFAAILLPDVKNTFEGEASMKLEALAYEFTGEALRKPEFEFHTDTEANYTANWLIQAIEGRKNGIPHSEIAAAFHFELAKLIRHMAEKGSCRRIAFSGGVFQNALLTDILIGEMKDDYELFFHKELSPNDECIAFGQLVLHKIAMDKQKQLFTLEKEHS